MLGVISFSACSVQKITGKRRRNTLKVQVLLPPALTGRLHYPALHEIYSKLRQIIKLKIHSTFFLAVVLNASMASYRHQHRRRSMEEPLDMLSDVNDLKEELYKLHEKISPECQEHIKKMNTLLKEFEEEYRHAVRVSTGGTIAAGLGVVVMIVGLFFSVYTMGASAIVAGIGAAAAAGGIAFGIVQFKTQKEKNLRKSHEDQLTELQTKISPVIDVLKKIYLRVQDMRNPKLSEHQANAIREHFSCFEEIQLLQIDDNRVLGSPMHESLRLTGNLSETFAEISRMLERLDEILEDDDEGQNDNDRPADTTTEKEMEKEFKEKAEKFIDEMKKGIKQLENVMKDIDQIKKTIKCNLTK